MAEQAKLLVLYATQTGNAQVSLHDVSGTSCMHGACLWTSLALYALARRSFRSTFISHLYTFSLLIAAFPRRGFTACARGEHVPRCMPSRAAFSHSYRPSEIDFGFTAELLHLSASVEIQFALLARQCTLRPPSVCHPCSGCCRKNREGRATEALEGCRPFHGRILSSSAGH